MLSGIKKIVKNYKIKRMWGTKIDMSRSVVVVDRNVNNALANITQNNTQINIGNSSFSDFASLVAINNALSSFNEIAIQVPSVTFEKHFKSNSFVIKLELGRFGVWQIDNFTNTTLSALAVFNAIVGVNAEILQQNTESLGINAEFSINANNNNIQNVINRIFQTNITSIQGFTLLPPSLQLPFRIDDNCVIYLNISFNIQNNQIILGFNADNKVLGENTITEILNRSFNNNFDTIGSSILPILSNENT